MNRDDIIHELGWERGWVTESDLLDRIERIARLAAADEREACARVCEDVASRDYDYLATDCAAAIRARGEK